MLKNIALVTVVASGLILSPMSNSLIDSNVSAKVTTKSTAVTKTYKYSSDGINTNVNVKYPDLSSKFKTASKQKTALASLEKHAKKQLKYLMYSDGKFWETYFTQPTNENGDLMDLAYNETSFKIKVANIATSNPNYISYKFSYYIESNVFEGVILEHVTIANVSTKTGKLVSLSSIMKNNSRVKKEFYTAYVKVSLNSNANDEYYDLDKESLTKETEGISYKDYLDMYDDNWYVNKNNEVFIVYTSSDNDVDIFNLYKFKFESRFSKLK